MQDLLSMLKTIRRPQLLIRAARAGTLEYRRDPHLHRLLGHGVAPRAGAALMRLIEMEGDLDLQRREDAASYSISRHVEVLTAMMAEAKILNCSTGPA